LVFATLADDAGELDFGLLVAELVAEVELKAGACADGAGAGCGLGAALVTAFGFFEALGAGVDFAAAVALAVAAEVEAAGGAEATGADEVSATVRTAETGAAAIGFEFGGTCATVTASGARVALAATAGAAYGAGAGFDTGLEVDPIEALVDAAGAG
jgi:hypothetical protein